MRRRKLKRFGTLLCAFTVALGCTPNRKFVFNEPSGASHYQDFATQIEYPNVKSCLSPESATTAAPLTTDNPSEIPAWEMTLDDAIKLAMQRTDVMRTLGASVVQAPAATRTGLIPR